MAKLHELLAVEGNLKTTAFKALADLLNTFEKKRHHFSEKLTTFKSFEENKPDAVEAALDLQSTIPKEIDWIKPFLAKAIDAGFQVAEANTAARADVVLDNGHALLSQIPATALLELEKRIKELQDFIMLIPTLDPAKGFTSDAARGADVFQARPISKTRTKKENKPLLLAPATDKHPAQVQLVVEDVAIGTILEQEWSGLITTSRKGTLIERVEEVLRSVKQARARANETVLDASQNKIGNKLLDHIFGA